jgi:hypothetical protein
LRKVFIRELNHDRIETTTKYSDRLLGISHKQISELQGAAQISKAWCANIRASKSPKSGGPKGGEQKRVAAAWAYDLLKGWTDQKITCNRDGAFVRVARLLFEIATKRRDHEPEAEMERACRAHLDELFSKLYPGARNLRPKRLTDWEGGTSTFSFMEVSDFAPMLARFKRRTEKT